MNKTTIKAMKAIRLEQSYRDRLSINLLRELEAKTSGYRSMWEQSDKPAIEIHLTKILRRMVPTAVTTLFKKHPEFFNVKAGIYYTVALPQDDKLNPFRETHVHLDSNIPHTLPVARNKSTIAIDELPDSKEKAAIIKIVLALQADRAQSHRDRMQIVNLLGGHYRRYYGSNNKVRAQAKTLYDLFVAWPALAHQYCNMAYITMPTDENSEEQLKEREESKGKALALANPQINAANLKDMAARYHLPYDVEG